MACNPELLPSADASLCCAASEVQAVLADEAARSLSRESPDFWVMVAALADFVATDGHGKLPVQACPAANSSSSG